MKEPLYRAKMRNSNEWICGYYFKRNGYCTIKPTDKDGNSYGAERPVDKLTLCEYSGLTDRNGNKIFEYDIVKTPNGHHLLVLFREFMWQIVSGVNQYFHRIEDTDKGKFEVVGNIYDNPELLEKGEN